MILKPIHKKIAFGGCVAVVCLVAAAGVWVIWPTTTKSERLAADIPVPTSQNAQDVVTTMSKISFSDLSQPQRKELMDKMRDSSPDARAAMFQQSRNLPEDQRRQFRSNMRSGFREMMRQRVDEYSKLKTKEEKDAYLDKAIDEMQEMHKRREQERANNPNRDNNRGNWRNMSQADRAKRRKERLDTTSAQDRAKFMAYREAIHRRMKERGIEMPRRH